MENLKCDVSIVHQEIVDEVKTKMTDMTSVERTATLFNVLGNPTRLRIVDLLSQHEMCVCDIAVVMDMTQSSISHQLSKMKKEGVVISRREGSTIFYSLKDQHIKEIYLSALTHSKNC